MLFYKITIILLLTLPLILFAIPAEASGKADFAIKQNNVMVNDERVRVLKAYLHKQNSPLEGYSQDIINASDKYNVDWKLLVAISGVESTFGKFIPPSLEGEGSSYNGWGWGIYGDQVIYFKSWTDGVDNVAQGLKLNYIDQGLTTPYEIGRIYSASPTWGARVSHIIDDINEFEITFEKDNPILQTISLMPHTAGISAQIAQTNLF